MMSPKVMFVAYTGLVVLLSAISLAENAPRPVLWTLIAVLAYAAARLRASSVPLLAAVATVPPVLAGLVARGAAGLVPALVFGLVFGVMCLALAQLGWRSSVRDA
jgi:hypothetical protein